MKCPLCDGTIENGRCKACGMPYRNDEVLYHLNESRGDHYRHASDKARRIMQEQQKAGRGAEAKSIGRSSARESGRMISRQAIQEQQKKVRQEAMRKITGAGNTARTVAKSRGTTGNMQNSSRKKEKSGKGSKFGKIWMIIVLLAALSPVISDLGDIVEESQNDYDIATDSYFYSWDEDGYKYYSIAAGFGTAQAGVQFEPGKYSVYTDSDEVTLEVDWDTDDAEEYTLKRGDDTLLLTFDEGVTILVESEESDYDSIYMKENED